jgi:hypothetical protein
MQNSKQVSAPAAKMAIIPTAVRVHGYIKVGFHGAEEGLLDKYIPMTWIKAIDHTDKLKRHISKKIHVATANHRDGEVEVYAYLADWNVWRQIPAISFYGRRQSGKLQKYHIGDLCGSLAILLQPGFEQIRTLGAGGVLALVQYAFIVNHVDFPLYCTLTPQFLRTLRLVGEKFKTTYKEPLFWKEEDDDEDESE